MALDVEQPPHAQAGAPLPPWHERATIMASEIQHLLVSRMRERLSELAGAMAILAFGLLIGGVNVWLWLLLSVGMVAAVLLPGDPNGRTSSEMALPSNPPAIMAPATMTIDWRTLLDAISDPAIVLDDDGELVHFNPAVGDLFPRVRVGQPLSRLTRSPELHDAIEQARTSEGRVIVELEDRVPIKRRVSAIVTSLVPVRLSQVHTKQPTLLIVFRDITDQEKLAQMRADFISYASHELRTPLASLRGFVETLQGPARNDPEAREKFLAIMGAQALRMTRLIDDLLSLSRVEMRVHVPPQSYVDLDEVVCFVTEAMQPVAAATHVALTLKTYDLSCEVRGDREELVQVFQNLIQNAIKYGKPNGHVAVTVAKDNSSGRFAVSVTDDGPGIEEHHLPRLTERFYRISANASRDKGGTGLGLAIVKNIVNRHRGELQIQSQLGVGSTFTVLLPPSPEPSQFDLDTP